MGRVLAELWGNSSVACEYDVAGSCRACFAEYLRDRDAALEAKTRDSKHNLMMDTRLLVMIMKTISRYIVI